MRKITTIVSGTLIYWLMTPTVLAKCLWISECDMVGSDVNVKENIAAMDVDEILSALF
uniref:Uncharacterized protein n=1 Tax=Candidatus Kentrum sp. UNK TaxID=2126344 RepID=A0A451ATC5_9GAMM|nr:MAG: hypothetical protein BECKUNK1418G_GA0071005_13561 [Candidatus Kentron sp. UNK]VFK73897.1 MAG: hypothetical protein BECKUNK1418H_GA0071006_13521 [Candidatus Kentron sp. UNK]